MKKENEKRPIVLLHKPSGMTPLEALIQFKRQFPTFSNEKLSYAGRLDPMADGLLLVLVGEENNNRKKYEQLPKTYRFTILIGVSTDSYDILGKIVAHREIDNSDEIAKIMTHLASLQGEITLPYPPFSAKRIGGHPLFWYARNDLLDTIPYPYQTTHIHNISLIHTHKISLERTAHSIRQRIGTVGGEFRQQTIINNWNRYFETTPTKTFTLLEYETTVSSGTYIRGIVHHVENHLHIPMLTFSITRTHIGPYTLPITNEAPAVLAASIGNTQLE